MPFAINVVFNYSIVLHRTRLCLFVKVKFVFMFLHTSCVYLNKIVPGIRYGQTTFTIKTDKLSMPDISPFYIKYDNSVTNNTFPIEILRKRK